MGNRECLKTGLNNTLVFRTVAIYGASPPDIVQESLASLSSG